VGNDTEGYKKLMDVVKRKNISQKFVTSGERITIDSTSLTILWPSQDQMATARFNLAVNDKNILGASIVGELNDYSVVLWLRYGSFDALFPGDADTHVEDRYRGMRLADDKLEVLKVPHHGSKTGMTEAFLDWLKPQLAIISVGKNSYGHPAANILQILRDKDTKILRTDEVGDIEVVSDGETWTVISTKTPLMKN